MSVSPRPISPARELELSPPRLFPSLLQFVYPFTLEPHILSLSPSHRASTSSRQASHVAYLLSREQAKEDRRKKELARVAPGWGGGGSLVPDRPAQKAPIQPQIGVESLPVGSRGTGPSFLETELAGLDLSSSSAGQPNPSSSTNP